MNYTGTPSQATTAPVVAFFMPVDAGGRDT